MTEEMKETFEIDEIFNEWKTFLSWCYENNDKTVEIHRDKIEYVMNYITNLQKENQSLKEKLNCKEYFSSTMPENTEFVILTKENYDKQQKDLALENIILKSKKEKAVELLQLLHYKFADGDSIHHDIEDIQKELQGGDE